MFACCGFSQQALSIITKSDGVVNILFSDNPEISFPDGDILKVTSANLSIEYPFSEVESFSFVENATAIKQVEHTPSSDGISIFNLSGKLIKKTKLDNGVSGFDWQSLPSGVYIVKNGNHTYKLIHK